MNGNSSTVAPMTTRTFDMAILHFGKLDVVLPRGMASVRNQRPSGCAYPRISVGDSIVSVDLTADYWPVSSSKALSSVSYPTAFELSASPDQGHHEDSPNEDGLRPPTKPLQPAVGELDHCAEANQRIPSSKATVAEGVATAIADRDSTASTRCWTTAYGLLKKGELLRRGSVSERPLSSSPGDTP
jgi:hypothetical protein